VRINGQRIDDLPLKEFEFLRALLCRAPEVMSNSELRLSLRGRGVDLPAHDIAA
jgi:hypothetical protein